jgi:hypothetical protein
MKRSELLSLLYKEAFSPAATPQDIARFRNETQAQRQKSHLYGRNAAGQPYYNPTKVTNSINTDPGFYPPLIKSIKGGASNAYNSAIDIGLPVSTRREAMENRALAAKAESDAKKPVLTGQGLGNKVWDATKGVWTDVRDTAKGLYGMSQDATNMAGDIYDLTNRGIKSGNNLLDNVDRANTMAPGVMDSVADFKARVDKQTPLVDQAITDSLKTLKQVNEEVPKTLATGKRVREKVDGVLDDPKQAVKGIVNILAEGGVEAVEGLKGQMGEQMAGIWDWVKNNKLVTAGIVSIPILLMMLLRGGGQQQQMNPGFMQGYMQQPQFWR